MSFCYMRLESTAKHKYVETSTDWSDQELSWTVSAVTTSNIIVTPISSNQHHISKVMAIN